METLTQTLTPQEKKELFVTELELSKVNFVKSNVSFGSTILSII